MYTDCAFSIRLISCAASRTFFLADRASNGEKSHGGFHRFRLFDPCRLATGLAWLIREALSGASKKLAA